MMVTEGGTGSKTSGPSVRRIYESLFGVTNGVVDPSRSVLIGGEPQAALPVIASDGTVTGPTGKKAGVVSARAASGRSR